MKKKETIVIVSGYFNPIHFGHISLFKEAKKLGDKLVVIVNNDKQVTVKGSFPFMKAGERKSIIESISYVDMTYLSLDKDRTVCKTIEELHDLLKGEVSEFIFANGGPRKKGSIPEYETCTKLGIKMVFNVGGVRKQSSSWLIQNTGKCEEHGKELIYCEDCTEKSLGDNKKHS